ncbi:UDP-glucose dehydrogenase family protein [Oceanibacterium hippocampi]|uniref:UDP-glucose 6-dehydrogenase n=1 Tax=Oceanibacterium hippocampi TaxID=745714 RepID=A0A1Y5SIB4_9PROT|nr:UDP-glucose/GDP-mannose dehydrogenase family protein [Oceanibacterium hippocampi]SLN41495.1 UDP-glucose 6-dehydrogenase TuaD [Oceanibacterium hippocampi]
MHVAMIGTGYVGLVSGACFSEFGHDVVCVDKDADRIAKLKDGKIPIYEPGLEALVERNVRADRLHFTTDLKDAVPKADAVFIAVGTPSRRGDGEADLTYVFDAAREIAGALDGYTVVVTKSTVPVGTGRKVKEEIEKASGGASFDIASNPEFLREGAAIEDFMRPDRVVCGVENERAREVMREIYRPLFLNETPVVFATLETSELIKYAANGFLATKISFINQMADLCEAVGADIQQLAKGIGLDGRIGSKFLHPGPGFGGSCFPKDTRALVSTARKSGVPQHIIEAVVQINEDRRARMVEKIVAACDGDVNGKTLAVLGLTFKPNTDDMRESPSVGILPALLEMGANIHAYDPEGMDEAAKNEALDGLLYCHSAYDTMKGADALVIITEWNQFRALDLDRVKKLMKQPVMIDLRNIYKPEWMAEAGFRYVSVGRTTVPVK